MKTDRKNLAFYVFLCNFVAIQKQRFRKDLINVHVSVFIDITLCLEIANFRSQNKVLDNKHLRRLYIAAQVLLFFIRSDGCLAIPQIQIKNKTVPVLSCFNLPLKSLE